MMYPGDKGCCNVASVAAMTLAKSLYYARVRLTNSGPQLAY